MIFPQLINTRMTSELYAIGATKMFEPCTPYNAASSYILS